MMDYQKLYAVIFNAVTDAVEQLELQNFGVAREILIRAQLETEEQYMCEKEEEPNNL